MLTQTGVFLFCAQNLSRIVDALLNTRLLCITSPLKITRWRLAACAHFCSAVRPILLFSTAARLNSICARLGPMILGFSMRQTARASALPVRQKKRVELNITLGVVCYNEVWISPPRCCYYSHTICQGASVSGQFANWFLGIDFCENVSNLEGGREGKLRKIKYKKRGQIAPNSLYSNCCRFLILTVSTEFVILTTLTDCFTCFATFRLSSMH